MISAPGESPRNKKVGIGGMLFKGKEAKGGFTSSCVTEGKIDNIMDQLCDPDVSPESSVQLIGSMNEVLQTLGAMEKVVRAVLEDDKAKVSRLNCYRVLEKYARNQVKISNLEAKARMLEDKLSDQARINTLEEKVRALEAKLGPHLSVSKTLVSVTSETEEASHTSYLKPSQQEEVARKAEKLQRLKRKKSKQSNDKTSETVVVASRPVVVESGSLSSDGSAGSLNDSYADDDSAHVAPEAEASSVSSNESASHSVLDNINVPAEEEDTNQRLNDTSNQAENIAAVPAVVPQAIRKTSETVVVDSRPLVVNGGSLCSDRSAGSLNDSYADDDSAHTAPEVEASSVSSNECHSRSALESVNVPAEEHTSQRLNDASDQAENISAVPTTVPDEFDDEISEHSDGGSVDGPKLGEYESGEVRALVAMGVDTEELRNRRATAPSVGLAAAQEAMQDKPARLSVEELLKPPPPLPLEQDDGYRALIEAKKNAKGPSPPVVPVSRESQTTVASETKHSLSGNEQVPSQFTGDEEKQGEDEPKLGEYESGEVRALVAMGVDTEELRNRRATAPSVGMAAGQKATQDKPARLSVEELLKPPPPLPNEPDEDPEPVRSFLPENLSCARQEEESEQGSGCQDSNSGHSRTSRNGVPIEMRNSEIQRAVGNVSYKKQPSNSSASRQESSDTSTGRDGTRSGYALELRDSEIQRALGNISIPSRKPKPTAPLDDSSYGSEGEVSNEEYSEDETSAGVDRGIAFAESSEFDDDESVEQDDLAATVPKTTEPEPEPEVAKQTPAPRVRRQRKGSIAMITAPVTAVVNAGATMVSAGASAAVGMKNYVMPSSWNGPDVGGEQPGQDGNGESPAPRQRRQRKGSIAMITAPVAAVANAGVTVATGVASAGANMAVGMKNYVMPSSWNGPDVGGQQPDQDGNGESPAPRQRRQRKGSIAMITAPVAAVANAGLNAAVGMKNYVLPASFNRTDENTPAQRFDDASQVLGDEAQPTRKKRRKVVKVVGFPIFFAARLLKKSKKTTTANELLEAEPYR